MGVLKGGDADRWCDRIGIGYFWDLGCTHGRTCSTRGSTGVALWWCMTEARVLVRL